MKIDDIMNRFDAVIAKMDSIVVSNDEAWMNEDGTDHARIDGQSVFLDIEDGEIRKQVFTRSILRAIQKRNWHTDVIRTLDDVDTSSENAKIAVFNDGKSNMFPDYRIYLREDGIRRNELAEKTDHDIKTLWKTDHEFFLDAVKDITSMVIGYDEYCGYFIKYFNRNDYGITIEDVKKDSEAVKIIKDAVFDDLTDPDHQFTED